MRMTQTNPLATVKVIASHIRRLHADDRGNIMIIMAFAMIPLLFAIGFGVDYARAERIQTQLNAAADAAALAAVDPQLLCQTSQASNDTATAMFAAQSNGIIGLQSITPTITINPNNSPAGCSGALRTATVSYTASVSTIMSSIMGITSLPIGGSATANASQPPNINFYLAVDTSPSMLIPSTTTGITQLQGATQGCAFACHMQTPPSMSDVPQKSGKYIYLPSTPYTSSGVSNQIYALTDNAGHWYDTKGNAIGQPSSGLWSDGYWLAQNYGLVFGGSAATIDLRINDAAAAMQQLIPYAWNTSKNLKTTYGFQMFQFSYNGLGSGTSALAIAPFDTLQTLTSTNYNSLVVPNLGDSAHVQYWVSNDNPSSSVHLTYDWATDFTHMFNTLNNAMPTPGTGANGQAPQEVLLLITDGMADEYASGYYAEGISTLQRGPLTGTKTSLADGTDLGWCNAIKKRNITIAVLYTQYLPSSIASGYSYEYNQLSPTDTIAPALQACASTNGAGQPLFYQVSVNQDISAALQALFNMTVQSARLVQ